MTLEDVRSTHFDPAPPENLECPVSLQPLRTSDKDNSNLSSATAPPQCTTTLELPVSKRNKSGDRQLGPELMALRALLAKTQEELTEAQEREKRARYLAFHDDLTALPNRRFFRERLDLALSSHGTATIPLAVLYLDLDGFKSLNDLYGHDTGDELLSAVARRLSHALRAEDLVSRLAGDEYACLISGVYSRERLRQIAATLFHAVSAPFKIGALELIVRPSIGIAVYPQDGSTTDELMSAADSAMYIAKRNKSSYAFFRAALRHVTGTQRRG
jgi:diguanylate cyclase (GGDEF)-like protein